MINDILKCCYEQGWSDTIYNINGMLTTASQVLFLLFYRKKYNLKWFQAIVIIGIVYSIRGYLITFLTWVENGFQNWGGGNFERVCVFIPLLAIPIAKLLKLPFGKVIDYLAVGTALQKVLGPFACPFFGCCYGIDCSWGIWNPITGANTFPVQWLECIVQIFVVWYLLRLAKKENYAGTGRVYAHFLLVYGSARFLIGFLKGYDKLFLEISFLELHALLMILVGTAWIMVLYEKEQLKAQKHNSIH
jgi:prolipoprotein diacylglyceryltransferase